MNYIFHNKKPDNYKGFVYLVTIHHDKPMNKYGGSKQGEFNYNYEGSPETNKEIYFEDLGKYDSTMEVWFKKLYRDACTSEGKMLRESNAAKSKEWYNASNVSGHVTTGVNPHLPSIVDGFKNEEFRIKEMPKEDIYAINFWQGRPKEVPGHVSHISAEMYNRGQAYLDDKEPVAILEDFYEKGNHLRVGGWHHTKASMGVPIISTLKGQFCPKSIWKKLFNNVPKGKDKYHFIKTLAKTLNPPIKNI